MKAEKSIQEFTIRVTITNGFFSETVSAKTFGAACDIISKQCAKRFERPIAFVLLSQNGVKTNMQTLEDYALPNKTTVNA
jgi:hypothetical protein